MTLFLSKIIPKSGLRPPKVTTFRLSPKVGLRRYAPRTGDFRLRTTQPYPTTYVLARFFLSGRAVLPLRNRASVEESDSEVQLFDHMNRTWLNGITCGLPFNKHSSDEICPCGLSHSVSYFQVVADGILDGILAG